MKWTNLTFEERIKNWKDLRNNIGKTNNNKDDAETIAKFFGPFPSGSSSLDIYNSVTWPSPWDLFLEDRLCTSGVSLLMYYTFKLSDSYAKIQLVLGHNTTDGTHIIPIIDDNLVLNYHKYTFCYLDEFLNRNDIVLTYSNEEIPNIF